MSFTVKLIFYVELTESAEESRFIKMASWSNLNQKSQKKYKMFKNWVTVYFIRLAATHYSSYLGSK